MFNSLYARDGARLTAGSRPRLVGSGWPSTIGRHIAALVNEALLRPECWSWIKSQIRDDRLRVVERVEYKVTYEESTNMGDRIFHRKAREETLPLDVWVRSVQCRGFLPKP